MKAGNLPLAVPAPGPWSPPSSQSLCDALSSFEDQLKDTPPQANLLITSRRTPPPSQAPWTPLRAAVIPLSSFPVSRASEITIPSICSPTVSVPSQEKVAHE